MKTNLAWLPALFLIVPIVANGASETFVAPDGSFSSGNGHTSYPFLIHASQSMRYQQVFAASGFSQLPPGGGTISKLWLTDGNSWGYCGCAAYIQGVQINLSTTAKAPDSLSPVFADNLGGDNTTVLPNGAYNFEGSITLAQPFLFDPSKGNLLLDVRIYSGSDQPFPAEFLATRSATNDATSRVYSLDVNSTTAGAPDTTGLLMGFTITLVPEPSTIWILGAGLVGLSVRLFRANSEQNNMTRTAEAERKKGEKGVKEGGSVSGQFLVF